MAALAVIAGITGFAVRFWSGRGATLAGAEERVEAAGGGQELAARAGEDDGAAVQDDRPVGQFERQPGVLLDQQQREIARRFQPVEPGQQRIDDDRRQPFERLERRGFGAAATIR